LKAVILAAGLGTRLLPATKEVPKEMLPVFLRDKRGRLIAKPFLHLIFDVLYDSGFRKFAFIIGRGKRTIEDYFTPDREFVDWLKRRGKEDLAMLLEELYERLRSSFTIFINQPEPLGTGDALLYAEPFTDQEPFLLHFGDDLLLPDVRLNPVDRLTQVFNETGAEAVLALKRVKDPSKYGIAVCEREYKDIYRVSRIEEKPKFAKSNLALVSLFIFKSGIYDAIRSVGVDKVTGEVMLTSGIQRLIDEGKPVYAVDVSGVRRVEVGSPQTYREALQTIELNE